MAVQIQLRRGPASLWTLDNPMLAPGEIGLELDTLKFKIGNGTLYWNDLSYGGLVGSAGPAGPAGPPGPLPAITAISPLKWDPINQTLSIDNQELDNVIIDGSNF